MFFIMVGLLGFMFSFDMFRELHLNDSPGKWPLVSTTIFICIVHLIIGIGIAFEKKWAFRSLKIYLYLSLLAFPIGTYLSYSVLKFIKKNRIASYF